MQTPSTTVYSRWEQTFSCEPFVLVGVPPADEASIVLVEEALRNAIRELEWIEVLSAVKLNPKASEAVANRFFKRLRRSADGEVSSEQRAKQEKLRVEIQEIFASEQRQRTLIEEHLKLREALVKQDQT